MAATHTWARQAAQADLDMETLQAAAPATAGAVAMARRSTRRPAATAAATGATPRRSRSTAATPMLPLHTLSNTHSPRQRMVATRAMALLLTPMVSRLRAATEAAMAVLLLPAVAEPASGRSCTMSRGVPTITTAPQARASGRSRQTSSVEH